MDSYSSHSATTTPHHRHHHHHRSSDRSRSRTSSTLARIGENGNIEPIRISLDLVPSPTTIKLPSTSSRSPLSLLRSPNNASLPLRELLLLSPSPARKSKPRFDDELPEAASGVRRRCKSRGAQMGLLCSPRSSRRSRREEKEVGLVVDEVGKQRKRRHSGRPRKEKLSLVPFQPPSASSSPPKAEEETGGDLDRVGQFITDLIMWRDVSKSTFWFGFGSLCFLTSFFTKGVNFSIFSALSQLAILLLAFSFFLNSVSQRDQAEKRGYPKLKEDDILRLAKLILPALNLAISKTRELFSGEPSITLKLAPFLLLGAEYGSLITIWRLSAIGFFVSFSIPKLYSCYSNQISQRAECLKLRLLGKWNACTHKKIVIASALIAFWNLSTLKTRIFTTFILLVTVRYLRQNAMEQVEDRGQKALLIEEPGKSNCSRH